LGRYPIALANWEARLKQDDPEQCESAVAEALILNVFFPMVNDIQVAEDPAAGGMDFFCKTSAGQFHLEVTNISRAQAANASGFPIEFTPNQGMAYFEPLTRTVLNKIRGKARQASLGEGPSIVLVSTLHYQVSASCFRPRYVEYLLTSRPKITGNWDSRLGEVVGDLYQATDLRQSIMVKPETLQAARRSVSAVICAGLGIAKPHLYGVLHPDAARPFNPRLLPRIPFARFREWPLRDHADVDWILDKEPWQPES
jgi:hypothetical protein